MSLSRRLLITGATGFIGSHVAAQAAKGEWDVHTDRVDLLDPAQSAGLMARLRPTHLIHLAWFVEPSLYWWSPENLRWVEASAHLLRAFAQHGGERFVGVGTSAEYDWNSGVLREGTTPLEPATLYGASKKKLAEQARAICEASGVSGAWARLFLVYGQGEPASRFVPKAILSGLTGNTIRCLDPVERDFIDVRDVAGSLLALAGSSVEGAVNVGTGKATSLLQVAQLVGANVELVPAGTEVPLVVADTTRLREEVGYSPQVTIERGMEDAVAWWRGRTPPSF